MKLAANIGFLYQELAPIDRIGAAAADGFDGVECPFPHDLDAALLGARLRDAGLPMVLINTPLGPSGEPGFAAVPGEQARFRSGIERSLDFAQRLQCPCLHVMAGRPGAGLAGSGESMAVLEDNLRWALPKARQAGVVLLLEALNHHDTPGYAYHQPGQIVAVLERLREPGVRLQFDCFHAAREGLDVSAALRSCQDWVHHVQVARAPKRTAPDFEDPDMSQAMNTLQEIKYRGWLGLEYHPQGPTTASLGWREPLRALLARSTEGAA